MNDLGVVNLSLDRQVPFEAYHRCRRLGSFILVDRFTNQTIGPGMIEFALRRAANIHWQAMNMNKNARAEQKMQKPTCIWYNRTPSVREIHHCESSRPRPQGTTPLLARRSGRVHEPLASSGAYRDIEPPRPIRQSSNLDGAQLSEVVTPKYTASDADLGLLTTFSSKDRHIQMSAHYSPEPTTPTFESIENYSSIPALTRSFLRAAKAVQDRLCTSVINGMLGHVDTLNVHGELQQRLDTFSNDAFVTGFMDHECVCAVVSEESDDPIVRADCHQASGLVVVLDPLDGSSNVDVNLNVGSIFAVYSAAVSDLRGCRWLPSRPLAAGYVLYGPSTLFVYSEGEGVHVFVFDAASDDFLLSHANLVIPEKGSVYSCNEGLSLQFPDSYQRYLTYLKGYGPVQSPYNLRYTGSLVADFHRILLKGGVFLYPPTVQHPAGKLRLLYEALPLAFIAEAAGGRALDGASSISTIIPTGIHQRTPLLIGGDNEIEWFLRTAFRTPF
jgi:fructose-1,6-bisphosphatase I